MTAKTLVLKSFLVGLLMFWSAWSCPIAIAAPQSSAQAIREILGPLWDKSTTTSDKAAEYFESLKIAGNDPKLFNAFIVNRIHYYRFREALPVAEQLVAITPDDPHAWMTKSWLEINVRSFDRSLLSLRRMKESIQPDDWDEPQLESFYIYMGQALGFLAGPASSSTNANQLRRTIGEIKMDLSPEAAQILQDHFDEMKDDFDSLLEQRDKIQEQFQDQTVAARQQEIQNLDSANVAMDERRKQLQPELDRLRAESRQEVQAATRRLQPLETELNVVSRQLALAESRWWSISQEIAWIQAQLVGDVHPNRRFWLQNRLNILYSILLASETELIAQRARHSSIMGQYTVLENERIAIAAQYNQQIAQVNDELAQLNRQQRRNITRSTRLATGPLPTSGQARSIDTRTRHFWTFSPYPTEERRDAILRSLKN